MSERWNERRGASNRQTCLCWKLSVKGRRTGIFHTGRPDAWVPASFCRLFVLRACLFPSRRPLFLPTLVMSRGFSGQRSTYRAVLAVMDGGTHDTGCMACGLCLRLSLPYLPALRTLAWWKSWPTEGWQDIAPRRPRRWRYFRKLKRVRVPPWLLVVLHDIYLP
jgi:hypothetical protein